MSSTRKSHFAAVVLGFSIGLTTTQVAIAGVDANRIREDPAHHTSTSAVLPAKATPFGYSLEDMARLTAAFNVGDRSGPPPNSPFQILYVNTVTNGTSFELGHSKFFYVPIVYADNSPPVLGDFPANAEDRRQLLPYWFSQGEVGMVTAEVIVDGVTVSTGAPYVQAVRFTQALPNTATQYVVSAVFLAPLPRGQHTVEIHSKATGDALRRPPYDQFFPDGIFESRTVYSVNVK